jgi:polar amino acid transport system substrate-binding protein
MKLIYFILALMLVGVLGSGCTDTDVAISDEQPDAIQAGISSSSVSSEELVMFVEEAYEYANINGKEAALQEFNDQNGQFIDGELYIFAYDLEGNTLALPFQPEIVGTNRWNTTDPSGTAYIQDLISNAKSGSGFSQYQYADPADNFTVKQKLSYVMMLDGDWLIGAGIYN